MSIKQVYNQVEQDKMNAVKGKPSISIDLQEYIDEHKELIKVLREGSREELLAEAEDKEEELEQCLADHGLPPLESPEEETSETE